MRGRDWAGRGKRVVRSNEVREDVQQKPYVEVVGSHKYFEEKLVRSEEDPLSVPFWNFEIPKFLKSKLRSSRCIGICKQREIRCF